MKNIIFLITVFFVSCDFLGKESTPDNMLDREKFKNVIVDLTLYEAALNVNPLNYTGNNLDSAYNVNVFKENGVTKAQYDTTLYYYSSRPKEFKEIMEEVLEQINIEKTEKTKNQS